MCHVVLVEKGENLTGVQVLMKDEVVKSTSKKVCAYRTTSPTVEKSH